MVGGDEGQGPFEGIAHGAQLIGRTDRQVVDQRRMYHVTEVCDAAQLVGGWASTMTLCRFRSL